MQIQMNSHEVARSYGVEQFFFRPYFYFEFCFHFSIFFPMEWKTYAKAQQENSKLDECGKKFNVISLEQFAFRIFDMEEQQHSRV